MEEFASILGKNRGWYSMFYTGCKEMHMFELPKAVGFRDESCSGHVR